MPKHFRNFSRLMWMLWMTVSGTSVALAQLEQTQRLEIPTSSLASEQFEVFSLGEEGILSVIRGDGYIGGRNEQWHFVKYDSTFRPVWKNTFKLDFRYIPVMAYKGEDNGYWLFAEPDTDRFLFLQLNYADGSLDTYKGNLLSGVDVQHFKVIGSKALVSGYYRSRPVVIVHSFLKKTPS